MAYIKNGLLNDNFDQARYDDNDAVARNVVRKFLEHWNYTVEDNDGKDVGKIDYNQPDLKATRDGKAFFFEVERKVGESTNAWDAMLRYGTVHIPARKTKYKNATFFCVVKPDETEIVLVPGQLVQLCLEKNTKGCKIISVQAKNRKLGRRVENHFCDIPNKLCIRFVKKEGEWVRSPW